MKNIIIAILIILIPLTFITTKQVVYERSTGIVTERIASDLDIYDKAIALVQEGKNDEAVEYLRLVRKVSQEELVEVTEYLKSGYLAHYPAQVKSFENTKSKR